MPIHFAFATAARLHSNFRFASSVIPLVTPFHSSPSSTLFLVRFLISSCLPLPPLTTHPVLSLTLQARSSRQQTIFTAMSTCFRFFTAVLFPLQLTILSFPLCLVLRPAIGSDDILSLVASTDLLGDGDTITNTEFRRVIADNVWGAARRTDDPYPDLPVHKVKLSYFKTVYESKNKDHALNLLFQKTKPIIDDNYKMRPRDVVVATSRIMLDYFLAVGNRPGIDMALPGNSALALSSPFHLDMHQPLREFLTTKGHLGFSPIGAMHFIGRRAMGEDIFIALAPTAFFDSPPGIVGYDQDGDSRLSPRHARIFLQLIGDILSLLHIGYDTHGLYTLDIDGTNSTSTTLGDMACVSSHFSPVFLLYL